MATMKDVAIKAKVSLMTVSRVINSPEKVKEETRVKVLEVMKKLQFKPNIAAKALAQNQTRTIHIFIQSVLSTQDPYLMALLAGISDVLSEAYYSFLIRREWKFPYLCDGVITLVSNQQDVKRLRNEMTVPIVNLGKTDESVDWIDFDHYQGSYQMTQYMIRNGHRNIGFIGIETNDPFASERLRGYQTAMKEAEIPISSSQINMVRHHTERSGYESALYLLDKNYLTGLVCSSDVLALGAMTAAKSLGYHVPIDLSIGGFDGVFLDQIANPPLTTIEQPVHLIGQKLAECLLHRIENPDKPLMRMVIPSKLIVRDTVRRPKDS